MTAVRDALSDFCYFVPFINAFGNGMIPSPKEFSSFLENKQVRIEDRVPLPRRTKSPGNN